MMSKQPPQPEPDERALFDEAMADVQPLERDRHLPKISFRQPVSISEHEHEVLRELDRIVSGEAPFELRDSDEFMEGAVRGFDPRTVRQLRRGEFGALLGWLRDNVHAHGRRWSAPELCQRITGKPLEHAPLLRHLETKLRTIYNI